jgi:hypothetical protein
MPRAIQFVWSLLLCCILAPAALALPAPMSDDELLLKSDLVGLVLILSVTCTSVDKDESTGEMLPSYSAKAELMEVVKGDEQKGDFVTITFTAVPTGLLGPWTVYYYPGEMVFTHLVGKNGNYTSTWWNARGRVVQEPISKDLPTKPGETVQINQFPKEHP